MVAFLELPISRDTISWKTITHDEYNFSVEYPTKWLARTYGEHGYKGLDATKLRIYESNLGAFKIEVRLQAAENPTLDDVTDWGKRQFKHSQQTLANRGEGPLVEIALTDGHLNGYPIVRFKSKNQGSNVIRDEVYLARSNDMIMIILQSEESRYEGHLSDFERILNSFTPLE